MTLLWPSRCHCADRWDHSLTGGNNGNSLCGGSGRSGLNADVVATYDTATSGYTFEIAQGDHCSALSETSPLRWQSGAISMRSPPSCDLRTISL